MRLPPYLSTILVSSLAMALGACGSNDTAPKTDTPGQEVSAPVEAEAPMAPAAAESDAAMASAQTEPETPAAIAPPVAAPAKDISRGKGGLESKCLARVAKVTGEPNVSLNHIDESEAATEIFVNVEGAQAPWRCLGYKDGTVSDVMYTGSEGAM